MITTRRIVESASTYIQHRVQVPHVGLVVDNTSLYFDPGVGFEGGLLDANDHLRGNANTSEQTHSGCRSLQTEDLLPIPNACHVDCPADLVRVIGLRRCSGDWISA